MYIYLQEAHSFGFGFKVRAVDGSFVGREIALSGFGNPSFAFRGFGNPIFGFYGFGKMLKNYEYLR